MVLTTFKDNLNEFLKNGSLYIALGIVALIVLTLIVIFLFNKKKK